ncbi:MAG: hypothetical protein Q9164_003252 [Protoblastenia rupestris]
MQLLSYTQLLSYLSLLLALPLIADCRPPDEPCCFEVPKSVQLRPNDVIKKSSSPLGSNGRGRTGSTDIKSFNELQLNLCNSGVAKCYSNGDSIPEGAELIYVTAPNVVTLNEICSDDIAELQTSLAEAWPTDYTYSVFMPAINKTSNAPYKCANQASYGSAVVGRVAASAWKGVEAHGGLYTAQAGGIEGRIFACASATGDHFACTTHLAAEPESIALAQCKALMFDTLPFLKSLNGVSSRTVVGGDFNLEYDTSDVENVQYCVPNGYSRKGDGKVQHVTYTNDLRFLSTKKYGLTYTDHDGFLVKLESS